MIVCVITAIGHFSWSRLPLHKVTSCVSTGLTKMCISYLQEEKGHTGNKQLVIVFLFCVLNHIMIVSMLVQVESMSGAPYRIYILQRQPLCDTL